MTVDINNPDFEHHSRSKLLEMQNEMVLTAVDLGMAGTDVVPRRAFRNREDALTTCHRLHDAIIAHRSSRGLDGGPSSGYHGLSNGEKKEKSVKKSSAVKEKEKEKKEAATGRRGRPGLALDAVITKLVSENPKREGSTQFEYWKLYRNGMTVAKFIEAMPSEKDARIRLALDVKRNLISVV